MGRPTGDNPEELKAYLADRLLAPLVPSNEPEDGNPLDRLLAQQAEEAEAALFEALIEATKDERRQRAS